jgi:hypothetical protein
VPQLVASELSWAGIEMFHQVAMPSRRALDMALGRVQRLSPSPQIVAPQHGGLVLGNDIARFVDRLGKIEVGPDVTTASERELRAANEIASAFEAVAGVDGARELKAGLARDGSFSRLFTLDGRRGIDAFLVAPRLALQALSIDAVALVPEAERSELREKIVAILRRNDIDLR